MKQVIVVDDEQIIADGISGLIKTFDLSIEEVKTFYSSESAFEYLRTQSVDLMITDINMPVCNGLKLIQKVQTISPLTQMIILTGFGTLDYATEAMKYGVKYFLQKPVDPTELEQAIHDSLIIGEQAKKNESLNQKAQIEQALLRSVADPTSGERNWSGVMYPAKWYGKVDGWLNQRLPTLTTPISGTIKDVAYYIFPTEAANPDWLARLKSQSTQQLPSVIIYTIEAVQLSTLHRHYLSALSIFEKNFYFSTLTVLNQSTTLGNSNDLLQLFKKFQEQLLQEIKTNHFSKAQEIVAAFFQDTQQQLPPVNLLKAEVQQLLNQLLAEYELTIEQFGKELPLRILYATHYLELRDLFLLVIQQLSLKQEINRSGDVIANLNLIIEQDYANPELSLRFISKNLLYLNPDYLGKLYVKKTGKKFNQALAEFRIQKAKELLQAGKKVYETAQLVGYGDGPEYFSKQFKKLTGSTPKKFQEMMD